MNIYAEPGTKVIFTGEGGYEVENKQANELLTKGETYTIEHIEVGDWNTEVWLKEVEGYSFNSVLFDDVSMKSEKRDM